MNKKFLASFLALTMTFGTLAAPVSENFISDNAVSVSAEENTLKYGNYEYRIMKNGNIDITNYDNKTEKSVDLKIPGWINGRKVTRISGIGFQAWATSIKFPNTITDIECVGYMSCMKKIVIPNSVKHIGKNAFGGSFNAKEIYIPGSVKKIDELAFSFISWPIGEITRLHLGEGIQEIKKDAFDSTNIVNLVIPKSVKKIGKFAFGYASQYFNIQEYNKYKKYYGTNGKCYIKIPGFKIKCYKNTAGERYAKENGFKYEIISEKKNNVTPSKQKITKVKSGKNYVKVAWKRNKKASGYQLKLCSNKKFKGGKVVKITKNKTTAKTIKKLKSNKKYYAKVRSYKKIGKKVYYGKWSTVKAVRTKSAKTVQTISALNLSKMTGRQIMKKIGNNYRYVKRGLGTGLTSDKYFPNIFIDVTDINDMSKRISISNSDECCSVVAIKGGLITKIKGKEIRCGMSYNQLYERMGGISDLDTLCGSISSLIQDSKRGEFGPSARYPSDYNSVPRITFFFPQNYEFVNEYPFDLYNQHIIKPIGSDRNIKSSFVCFRNN